MHRSHNGDFVTDLSHAGEVFAEMISISRFHNTEGATVIDGCLRFRIPGLLSGETTTEVKVDDALGRCVGISLKDIGQRQAERGAQAHLQSGTAIVFCKNIHVFL